MIDVIKWFSETLNVFYKGFAQPEWAHGHGGGFVCRRYKVLFLAETSLILMNTMLVALRDTAL